MRSSVRSNEQVEAVRTTVAPVVAALGLSLYDVELAGGGDARVLRITVAGEGDLDLDAVTRATQAISPVIDDAPGLSGPYLLEVSSPGVERTLRRAEHFQGARGEQVAIKFHTEAGPRRIHGELVDADDECCVVDAQDDRVTVPYADVTSARTVFEWGPQPRPGARSKQGKPRERAGARANERGGGASA
jgi:ribosome maturation factor RimP